MDIQRIAAPTPLTTFRMRVRYQARFGHCRTMERAIDAIDYREAVILAQALVDEYNPVRVLETRMLVGA